MRTVLRGAGLHWVGDGFPVRTLFSFPNLGRDLSPFLMLDWGGPTRFPPTDERLGVGEHPHRGFETVTIVWEGEVEHRDSSGGGGRIGPGDVQWMTVASGLVHEEFHGRDWARRGGPFEMAQLWVNLPARDKTAPPGYQAILAGEIPRVAIPGGGGAARVVAGELGGVRGPARTFTPMSVLDLELDGPARLEVPDGWTALLVVRRGAVRVAGAEPAGPAEAALLEREGVRVAIEAEPGSAALFLCGEPIDEPIAGAGPFVMNTPEEIRQAIADYHAGRMGRLA